ncbi:phosphatase PAP2 family protein [Rubellicoccus peritrichatus]|uniref:Phosphatase PAP2 family protein n=1 Tax=Rubellicoccus peritrichatus TaxID=3080537 RepID=A0AAQ3QPZ2_9BACT|nr:phosphatase PAP2 family protein [Puniceicoccus sp. CR14]WOO39638.1 phosphatase PAP2 family protein [Puniceicoccus sp. CR14]
MKSVFLRAILPAIVICALIPLAYVIPLLDSTAPPYFDLTQTLPQIAYWFSESGGKVGTPILAITLIILLVTRKGITQRRKWLEAGVFVLAIMISAGGGAWLNENLIKERLKVPRPNIIWLAGENGTGLLGMTPSEFYKTGDKEARSQLLEIIIKSAPDQPPLSPAIKAHWIAETGYSFPSGHAFSAILIATFFLATAVPSVNTNRICFFYALLPWALVVCLSRVILRVHSPTDIIVGALEGLIIGVITWTITNRLIKRFV